MESGSLERSPHRRRSPLLTADNRSPERILPGATTTTTTMSNHPGDEDEGFADNDRPTATTTAQELHQRHHRNDDGDIILPEEDDTGDEASSFQLQPRGGRRSKQHGSDLYEDGDKGNNTLAEHQQPDGLMVVHKAGNIGSEDEEGNSNFWATFAGVAGNVLEWYDFAVFGFFDDVIGEVFFPPDSGGEASAFLVFGGAFLMRPIGGVLLGYLGDTVGRKKALVVSIFLMAFPTFAMGCLPSYAMIGDWAVVLLIIVRLLQGLSVGGQLMSSLVFTLENHDPAKWGLYGSFVMAAANFGTLLGGIVGFALRESLTHEQLVSWGWRIPFVSGIFVSFSGFYLKSHGGDHDGHHYHKPGAGDNLGEANNGEQADDNSDDEIVSEPPKNPLVEAFSKENLLPLLASSMVPMLWSAGFYLSFVWMSIFMSDLIDDPVPGAFGINSAALFFSVCLLFPVAGILSDRYGRLRVMTIGGIAMGVLSPILVLLISRGMPFLAFFSQCTMGIALSLWGAPMCAWLVESFEPDARLTSVSIGYNIAQAIAGGSTPFLATVLSEKVGPGTPGYILTALAVISLVGLRCVARPSPATDGTTFHPTSFQSIPTATNAGLAEGTEFEMVERPPITVLDDDDNELL